MEYIKEYIKWFVIINTAVLIVVAINYLGHDVISVSSLWGIIISSAATALITTGFFAINPKKIVTRRTKILMFLIHYSLLVATMMALGRVFGWVGYDIKGFIIMALSVAGVYALSVFGSYLFGLFDAQRMNEALNKFKE